MTVAVCLKCGAMKHGAWTACPKCQHVPADPDDKARHVLVSDHYASPAELERCALQIQSGQPPVFDSKTVETLAAEVQDFEKEPKRTGRLVFGLIALGAVAILGITAVVYWLGRGLWR